MTHAAALNLTVPRDITRIRFLPMGAPPAIDAEVWECSRDQANSIVRAHRSEAWRVWLSEECDRWMMATPEEITRIIEAKRLKPGPYLKPLQ